MNVLKGMARVTLFGSRNDGSGVSFEPSRDIPSLAGKIILITGAAGDLGRQTTIELARYGKPARIYIADLPLDEDGKKELLNRIDREVHDGSAFNEEQDTTPTDLRYIDLDLTSFESVQKCAAEFIAQEERLDLLVLNAGIIRIMPGKTKEGYEIHFGLNYLGHSLLARLLTATMKRTAQQPDADVRLVVVSSEGHAMAPKGGIQFEKLKTDCAKMSYSQRYGQSKIALIAFMREFGHRSPEIRTVAVHPGRIITGMAASLGKESRLARVTAPIAPLLCVPVSVGIKNYLWAATSPNVISGKYYEPVGVPDKETSAAKDEELSRKLWDWTEAELRGAGILE
ncbi:uncharacterized protein F4822DRAFT_279442 [Hypoxylon trugodes]|uniref:uncharacterized protein n=1 Tax=Hypoxylon trugodes TaxID=326681 RepID=UPI0021921503|nr:uncharacterized protein F4822DRAFT_279442 [Hypoxylon trugodes]KAI1387327.1 hypothetical protein F4822DRAFT_279442 [Hypoxylon trugodes]